MLEVEGGGQWRKEERNLDSHKLGLKKNGETYLQSRLIVNSFHFLLLQSLYRGSVKDSVN